MQNQTTTVYILRHGETDHNKLGIMQGYSNTALNDAGIRQAKTAREKLKNVHFDHIYASDLYRAEHTARIISAGRNREVKTTHLIRERHYGIYEEQSNDAYFREYQKSLEGKTVTETELLNWKIHPSEESIAESLERFNRFMQRVITNHRNQTVLLVTHGGLMRYFLIYSIRYVSRDILIPGSIRNTGFFTLRHDGLAFAVTGSHNIEHI